MSTQKQTYATRRIGVGDMVSVKNAHPVLIDVDKESQHYTAHVIFTEDPSPTLGADTQWETLTSITAFNFGNRPLPSTATAVALRVTAISGEDQPRRGALMTVNSTSGEAMLGFNHRKRPQSGRQKIDFICPDYVPSVVGAREWDKKVRNRRHAALDGVVDGRLGTVSFWIKHPLTMPADGSAEVIFMAADGVAPSSGVVQILRSGTNGTQHLGISINGPTFPAINIDFSDIPINQWVHFLASWENTFPVDDDANLTGYVDGVEITDPGNGNKTQFGFEDVDFRYASEAVEWTQGSNHGGFDGDLTFDRRFQGCLSEFWLTFSERFDITMASNREKFRTAGGLAEDLGVDGSTPTGTAPALYSPDGELAFNQGTGGDIPCEPINGPTAVVDCADAPTKV